MKTHHLKAHQGIYRVLVAVSALLCLTQCASTVEKRIAKNPELFAKLSAQDQVLVQQRRLREGMSQEAVFLAAGKPDEVTRGRKSGRDFERWTYLGQRTVTTQTFGAGFGWGGWGGWGGGWCGPFVDPFFMGGPMMTSIPYEAARVEFMDGRVTSWETGGWR